MSDENRYARGRANEAGAYRWQFDDFVFDETQFRLTAAGQTLELEHKPLQVLALLLRHAGEIVTKQEFFDEIWGGRITVDHVLATAVGKLRRALGESGGQRIVTVPRAGYRFDGRVERIALGHAAVSSALHLEAEQCVPGRPHLHLVRALARTQGHEVWRVQHSKTRRASVFKFALDAQRLYALKREVTLARLLEESLPARDDHLRVLDWNFSDEPYWVEYEYAGINLLEWSTQPDGLSVCSRQQRLELFLQIADAVAAAHAVGVLHKDIKPANVLIQSGTDGARRVLLADFGSALLLQPERLAQLGITGLGLTLTTRTEADSGTPLYLAPELIAGQPPTLRSDIYALGLLLYQLVCGDLRTPMASGWERDIADDLLVQDISRASDGNPEQRFGSVAEFATQLRQLEVRRTRQAEQAQEVARMKAAQEAIANLRARRPWVMATIGVLVSGLITIGWLYWQADQARQQAELQANRAEAINRFLNWEVLANTGTTTTGGEVNPTMHGMLQRASQSVATSFADDPESEGWIRLAIGEGFAALNDHQASDREQQQAIELLDRTLGENADKTLDAIYTMAANLLEQGRTDEAILRLDLADARLQRLPGKKLMEQRSLPLRSHSFRGFAYTVQLRCEESLEQLRMAEAILREDPSQPAFNLFNIRSWIGNSLICMGRYEEARAHFQVLVDAVQEPDEDIGAVLPLLARNGLATALAGTGDNAAALDHSAAVLAALQQTIGADNVYTLTVEREDIQRRLTVGVMQQAAARDALQQVHERLRDLVGENAIQTLRTRMFLGAVQYAMGDTAAGIAHLRGVHDRLLLDAGAGEADRQAVRYHWARALFAAGEAAEATLFAADLDPAALRAALGHSDWQQRIADLQQELASMPAGRGS